MAPKHKKLNLAFFIPISIEERERDAEKEFASLNERLEKECAMAKEKEISNRPVGRPKKDKAAKLLRHIAIPMKLASNNMKKDRGSYHNWFTPNLWPPIFIVMKRH
jgi:hypothetical protein